MKYSVDLYCSSASISPLEDYLKRLALKNKKHIWVVLWNRETVKNATKPTSLTGCSLDGKAVTDGKDVKRRKLTIHSEYNSTREIANNNILPTEVSENMAILEDSKTTLLE